MRLLCNRSLLLGYVPDSQKCALVFPTIKKPGLDTHDPLNFRPISNLSFLSKTIEQLVIHRLLPYLERSGLLPSFQSGFRSHHSTETVLLKLLSDTYLAMDRSELTLLALFDVSAAFDTVDHSILLHRLHTSFGIQGVPLQWFTSYLTNRSQMVVMGDSRSEWSPIQFGVPQGSVLGPLLYLLYTSDLSAILNSGGLSAHLYADDTQAYIHGPVNSQISLVQTILQVQDFLSSWMSSNRLCLNNNKTQLIWLGSKHLLSKIDYSILNSHFPGVVFQSCVKNLGVILDSSLSFADHLSRLTRISFYHLKQLRVIRSSLSLETAKALTHAFIASRLDYCNSLLLGLPKSSLSGLQSVQNAAARLIGRFSRFSHISHYLHSTLRWLPVSDRIEFKILTMVSNSLSGNAPAYLSDLLLPPFSSTSRAPLRSASRVDLRVPSTRSSLARYRSFAAASPFLWNKLPASLRQSLVKCHSYSQLKTFFFTRNTKDSQRF